MIDTDGQPVWLFTFAVESEDGEQVSAQLAEELLDSITRWAEERGLQVGGGYRAPKPEELEPGPIIETAPRETSKPAPKKEIV